VRAEDLRAIGSHSRVTRLAESRPLAGCSGGAVHGRLDARPQHCSQPAGALPARMQGTERFRG
jgi:hypothetical protein